MMRQWWLESEWWVRCAKWSFSCGNGKWEGVCDMWWVTSVRRHWKVAPATRQQEWPSGGYGRHSFHILHITDTFFLFCSRHSTFGKHHTEHFGLLTFYRKLNFPFTTTSVNPDTHNLCLYFPASMIFLNSRFRIPFGLIKFYFRLADWNVFNFFVWITILLLSAYRPRNFTTRTRITRWQTSLTHTHTHAGAIGVFFCSLCFSDGRLMAPLIQGKWHSTTKWMTALVIGCNIHQSYNVEKELKQDRRHHKNVCLPVCRFFLPGKKVYELFVARKLFQEHSTFESN